MKYKAVLFDLDGTLLPMDTDEFADLYFKTLAADLAKAGYEPKAFIKAILKCVKAMSHNDGSRTNEEVFWDSFCEIYGEKAKDDLPTFDNYYKTSFDIIKECCKTNEYSAKVVSTLKEKGIKVIIATNPLFPKIAIDKRITWAGIDVNQIDYITSYENSSYCKPNPKYYKEILEKNGLSPQECMMVGNDVREDMSAAKIGMNTFLLTDYLINRENIDTKQFLQGNFKKLCEIMQNL